MGLLCLPFVVGEVKFGVIVIDEDVQRVVISESEGVPDHKRKQTHVAGPRDPGWPALLLLRQQRRDHGDAGHITIQEQRVHVSNTSAARGTRM